MVPDDSAGPVDVTESVPLTAEALEKLFWQQFQTTATQTSRSQTPENTCLDGETQTEITYDVTSLGPASLIDPLTIGDTDSAVSTTSYRISSYSFRGNYSFLNYEIQRSQYIRPKVTVHKGAETIQGRKLFKGGNYMRKYGMPKFQ